MKLFIYLLAVATVFIAAVDASPAYVGIPMKRMTNADRLKRGLGPAPPVFKRVIPGRSNLPTRAFIAKRGSPSPSAAPIPPPKHVGRIEVRNTTGFSYGFVENTVSGVSGVALNSSILPLSVSFSASSSPFDISATNAIFSGPTALGGVGNATLSATSSSAVVFNATSTTASGAPLAKGGESAIWSLNGRTNQISAHWINEDGSKPTTFIGLEITDNIILLTGNITLYNAAFPSAPLVPVEFFLATPPFSS